MAVSPQFYLPLVRPAILEAGEGKLIKGWMKGPPALLWGARWLSEVDLPVQEKNSEPQEDAYLVIQNVHLSYPVST
jgi:hypothetical protein